MPQINRKTSLDDGRKIYTVSELNREIKVVLEDTYPDIWLEGEVSNCKTYTSGHMYFSLKDAEGQISAVAFQGVNRFFKFRLEDGMKVIVRGRVSSYPKRGEYQIIVSFVEPAGRGALQLAFEQLKEKLDKEGLFCAERKKPIPLLPQKIGVVTSPTGAAIRDILSVIERRFANVEILLYPVRVQGDEAKFEIAEAVAYLNAHYPQLDVMLVGRGGGSYEDLWAFNEEIVARAIACSKIPVISCVGHEIDYTIADFVADLRAPTPSAAAEMVVRNKAELSEKLESLRRRLRGNMEYSLQHYDDRLRHLRESRALTRPHEIYEERLRDMDELFERMSRAMQRAIETGEHDFRTLAEKLNLLSPLTILNRGYSISYRDGRIVKEAASLATGDKVTVRLSKGEFTGRVEEIR